MSSPNYRYECLDLTGHLHETRWFYAESDPDALSFVEGRHPGCKCVIWREWRIIAKLGFDQPTTEAAINGSFAAVENSRALLRETWHLIANRAAGEA
jgi:hypothetical protein